MECDILDGYLNREVAVCFAPAAPTDASGGAEEGILLDYSGVGLLLERHDRTRVYIPLAQVRTVEIRPKPSFWQRITGTC